MTPTPIATTRPLTEIQREHRALRGHLADFEDQLSAVAGLPATVARFEDLRAEIVRHFAYEERDGYLEPALKSAPWLDRDAARLLAQHAEFVDEVDELLEQLRSADGAAPSGLRERYRRFRRKLEHHENRENRLLHRAFVRDVAAGD
jgi:hypothetical protein